MGTGKTIVLGVTGSIAAVKAPELVRLFRDKGYSVHCVLTSSAKEFVSPMALAALSGQPVNSNMFGEDSYKMPHLSLAAAADLFVVAPLTATVLGRMAYGLAEDLVTLTYITTTAPTLVAPAMHNTMWEHPATQTSSKILRDRGVTIVGPYQGPLADQTRGDGRMAEPPEIVKLAESLLSKKKS